MKIMLKKRGETILQSSFNNKESVLNEIKASKMKHLYSIHVKVTANITKTNSIFLCDLHVIFE